MALGSAGLVGAARVFLGIDDEEFRSGIVADREQFAASTHSMKSDLAGLTVAQVRASDETGAVSRAMVGELSRVEVAQMRAAGASRRYADALIAEGPASNRARNALIGLNDAQAAVNRETAAAAGLRDDATLSLDAQTASATRSSHGYGILGKAIGGLSVAFLGGYGLIGLLKSTVGAAESAQAATKQLAQAVKDSGGDWASAKPHIESTIASIEKLSGFDKVQLTQGLAQLVVTFGSVNKSLDVLGLATDVARHKNENLNTAIKQITRAALSQSGSMRTLGISIVPVTKYLTELHDNVDHATASQIAQAKAMDLAATQTLVLDAIQQKFAGDAKANMATAQGAQEGFTAALHDTEVQIGDGVLPQISNLLRAGTSWLENTKTQAEIQRDANTAVRDGVTAVKDIVGAIHEVSPVISTVVHSLGGLKSTVEEVLIGGLLLKARRAAGGFTFISDASKAASRAMAAQAKLQQASVTSVGAAAERTATTVGTASTTMSTEISGVGTAASGAATKVTLIGTDAVATEAVVGRASSVDEAELAGIGKTAIVVGGEEKAALGGGAVAGAGGGAAASQISTLEKEAGAAGLGGLAAKLFAGSKAGAFSLAGSGLKLAGRGAEFYFLYKGLQSVLSGYTKNGPLAEFNGPNLGADWKNFLTHPGADLTTLLPAAFTAATGLNLGVGGPAQLAASPQFQKAYAKQYGQAALTQLLRTVAAASNQTPAQIIASPAKQALFGQVFGAGALANLLTTKGGLSPAVAAALIAADQKIPQLKPGIVERDGRYYQQAKPAIGSGPTLSLQVPAKQALTTSASTGRGNLTFADVISSIERGLLSATDISKLSNQFATGSEYTKALALFKNVTTQAGAGTGTDARGRPAPGPYSPAAATSLIVAAARRYGVDPTAALRIANVEGLSGAPGDYGTFASGKFVALQPGTPGGQNTSFGPFQLHAGGELPAAVWARGPAYAQAWANSPAGIAYALKKIGSSAGGLTGNAALKAISAWENPAAPLTDYENALASSYAGAAGGGAGTGAGAGAGAGGGSKAGFFNENIPESYLIATQRAAPNSPAYVSSLQAQAAWYLRRANAAPVNSRAEYDLYAKYQAVVRKIQSAQKAANKPPTADQIIPASTRTLLSQTEGNAALALAEPGTIAGGLTGHQRSTLNAEQAALDKEISGLELYAAKQPAGSETQAEAAKLIQAARTRLAAVNKKLGIKPSSSKIRAAVVAKISGYVDQQHADVAAGNLLGELHSLVGEHGRLEDLLHPKTGSPLAGVARSEALTLLAGITPKITTLRGGTDPRLVAATAAVARAEASLATAKAQGASTTGPQGQLAARIQHLEDVQAQATIHALEDEADRLTAKLNKGGLTEPQITKYSNELTAAENKITSLRKTKVTQDPKLIAAEEAVAQASVALATAKASGASLTDPSAKLAARIAALEKLRTDAEVTYLDREASELRKEIAAAGSTPAGVTLTNKLATVENQIAKLRMPTKTATVADPKLVAAEAAAARAEAALATAQATGGSTISQTAALSARVQRVQLLRQEADISSLERESKQLNADLVGATPTQTIPLANRLASVEKRLGALRGKKATSSNAITSIVPYSILEPALLARATTTVAGLPKEISTTQAEAKFLNDYINARKKNPAIYQAQIEAATKYLDSVDRTLKSLLIEAKKNTLLTAQQAQAFEDVRGTIFNQFAPGVFGRAATGQLTIGQVGSSGGRRPAGPPTPPTVHVIHHNTPRKKAPLDPSPYGQILSQAALHALDG